MKKLLLRSFLATSLLATSGFASAGLIDLSTWQHDGQGSWTTQGANNDSVFQSVNGQPTVFFENGSDARNTAISGEITVQTTGDDDFIGFVLGYQDDELHSSSADYWLIDWKQGNQGSASRGLALSHVSNGSVTNSFWEHNSGITEIARGLNLGDTGWLDNTTYSFDIIHTASLIQVKVNDVVELTVTAAQAGVSEFTDGSYGFYNYSQSSVLYAGIAERQVSVPEPSTLAILGLGLLGLTSRRIKKS